MRERKNERERKRKNEIEREKERMRERERKKERMRERERERREFSSLIFLIVISHSTLTSLPLATSSFRRDVVDGNDGWPATTLRPSTKMQHVVSMPHRYLIRVDMFSYNSVDNGTL
jgi:hypothetical protein